MEAQKFLIFAILAAAGASRNYEPSGWSAWQGSDSYDGGLPSINIARSSGGWSNPSNSLGRSSSSLGADTYGWSGIYKYGINRRSDSYPNGWSRRSNLDGAYGDNQRNANDWARSSTGWNNGGSRTIGGWSSTRSGVNNGWLSTW